jgi:DNA-binding transcriptional LysR family regulator
MDRLDEWRIFLAVARLRSFAQAARTLGRSPQAVTRAVAAIEERLGTRLLYRTTRSVSLTDEGERHLERGRRAVAELDALESRSDAHAPLAGKLSITAPVLFGQLYVAPIVRELLHRHPELDVRLVLLDRVVSIAEEGLDVAVRIGPLSDSALRARLLGNVRLVLCASPAYLKRHGTPRTPEALSRHTCITLTPTTPIADRWSFPRAGRREQTVSVRARLVVNTAQAAIDAAVAGLGITRVLSYQIARPVADKKLQIILPSTAREAFPIHLVYLPGIQSRAAAAFVELATERLRAQLMPRRD